MMVPRWSLLGLLVLSCTSPFVRSQQDDPCGKSHGCFRDPGDCYPPSECTYYVSWTGNAENATLVDFELSINVGSGDKYAAVGLSQNDEMPQTDIYLCRSDEKLVRYYAQGYNLLPSDEKELKGIYNIVTNPTIDGILSCSFSRSIQLNDGDPEFFSMNGLLYVLLATSTFSGNTVTYHGINGRWLTSDPVDLLATGSAENDLQLPRAQKAHGILMVIAWMYFASTGIIFARYLKPFMADKTLCGNKIWFNCHRINMILAFTCFVTAFIVIFVVKGEFVDSSIKAAYAHAIFGCIAVALGVINPVMAIFRPHPGTPNRPIFNYAHRSVGLSGWVFAMIAIILTADFYFDPLAESISNVNAFWTIIAFLVIGVAIVIAFEIFDFICARRETEERRHLIVPTSTDSGTSPSPGYSGQSSDIAMQSAGGEKESSAAPPATPPVNPVEKWRGFIFLLAKLDIIICSIIMIVFIAEIEI